MAAPGTMTDYSRKGLMQKAAMGANGEPRPTEALTDDQGLPTNATAEVARAVCPEELRKRYPELECEETAQPVELPGMTAGEARRLELLRATGSALVVDSISRETVVALAVDTLAAAVAEARHEYDHEFIYGLKAALEQREKQRPDTGKNSTE